MKVPSYAFYYILTLFNDLYISALYYFTVAFGNSKEESQLRKMKKEG